MPTVVKPSATWRSHLLPVLSVLIAASLAQAEDLDWSAWHRPVDQNVFTTDHGNNHDTIFFVEPDHPTHKYHLIVSHETSGADYWRTNDFSWSSNNWELVSGDYDIGGQYEYDDGVKVGDTYYIYEAGQDDPNGIVYTYTGDLADADGNWTVSGSFPKADADDVGIWYEDNVFHMYGENGTFEGGFDGATLSHLTSSTGLGDWTVQRTDAVVPGDGYGVGDPTIAKIDGEYWLYCDREGNGETYRITAWKSSTLDGQFEFVDVAIAPREGETDDYDNHRVQDGDIGYVSELDKWVMFANVRDTDGNPGPGSTRFAGVFYSGEPDPEPEPEPGVIYESTGPVPVSPGDAAPIPGLGDLNNDDLGGNRTLIVEFDLELTSVTTGTDVTWFALGFGFDGDPGANDGSTDVVNNSEFALLVRTLTNDDGKDHQRFEDGDAADFGDDLDGTPGDDTDGIDGKVRITVDLSPAGIAADETATVTYEIDNDADGVFDDISAGNSIDWQDALNHLWLGSRGDSEHVVSNLRITAIPEPTAFAFLILGGTALLRTRGRRTP